MEVGLLLDFLLKTEIILSEFSLLIAESLADSELLVEVTLAEDLTEVRDTICFEELDFESSG